MSGFCVHDWHQTTEEDMQHQSLGGDEYLYHVWQAEKSIHAPRSWAARLAAHDALANAAHKLAEARNLIPYTQETLAALMDEVEAAAHANKDERHD